MFLRSRCIVACLASLLFLPPAIGFAAPPAGHAFNVVDYGAKPDGSAPATEAFRRAIAAAKAAGGGTIFVPAGNYISGPIELSSNMTLNIDVGATIRFPVAPLPLVQGRYLGVEALVPQPLIGGTDVQNVTVTGRGTLITGDYRAWASAYGPPPAIPPSGNANGPLWQKLLDKLEAGQPVSQQEYRAAATELRPSFICFTRASNVLVENLHIVGGPMFVVHLLYSTNATVRNMVIDSYPGPHANGIVADSSRFVRISDDYIDTGDDGIVIKSGKDADGLRVHRPASDITITNCTVHHAHGAVVLGSETSGGLRNIVASNITAVDTENGIRIKSRRGRGGVVEDARFDNWTMRHVGTGIEVTTYYMMGGETEAAPEPVPSRTPVFRNIAISHITIDGATHAVADIEGLPEMPVSGLWLTDVQGSGVTGLLATHTDGLELHHVLIDPGRGPAFAVHDAAHLELDDTSATHPAPGQPVIEMQRAPGAILRNSHALPGTNVFLLTGRGELRTLHLENNVLKNAASPVQEQ